METRTSPSSRNGRRPRRLEEYWAWFAAALFVFVTLDMLTTLYAAWIVGPSAEANPLIRLALRAGIVVYTGVNVAAAAIAIGVFYLLMRRLGASGPPLDRQLAVAVEAWLGLLVAVGLFVFANNLAVILHGRSLLSF